MSSPANTPKPFNKWAVYGFTTTPEERIGPGPPYSNSALQVNLFFRVLIGLISLFVTWVPARLLWRAGEFAGSVLCTTLLAINFMIVVNALIWHDDDVANWYAGYGWCDFQVYVSFPLHSAFNISLFEIMRGLASKVALNRVTAPTARERHRQRIISALVIFTVPVIQCILTYFVIVSRYNIVTLSGCGAMYFPSWVYLVFYIIPTPAYAVAAAVMAVVAFHRYRQIEKVTRSVLASEDDATAARQHRVRKKLYFMTLWVIIVVLPIVLALLVFYLLQGRSLWSQPYDFYATHFGPDPFNIYFISFTTTDMLGWLDMTFDYIALLAGIVVFIPFGTTAEAINMYRKCLLAVRLGHIFPKLKNEYHHSTRRHSRFSWLSSMAQSIRDKGLTSLSSSTGSAREDSLLPTVSLSTASEKGRRPSSPQNPELTIPMDPLQFLGRTVASSSTAHNPWPDLSADEIDLASTQIQSAGPTRNNPFTFRPAFPSLSSPGNGTGNKEVRRQPRPRDNLPNQHTHSHSSSSSSFSSTLILPTTATPSRNNPPALPLPLPPLPTSTAPPSTTPTLPTSTTTTGALTSTTTIPTPTPTTTTTPTTTAEETSPWTLNTPRRDRACPVGVDTRVWADHYHHGSGDPSSNNNNNNSNNRPSRNRDRTGSRRQRQGPAAVVIVETSIARSTEVVNGGGGGAVERAGTRAGADGSPAFLPPFPSSSSSSSSSRPSAAS
ncbi:hypothetical protein VTK26DRAFT_1385 [Humicola hyalothermophila]